jgi:GAF domain-containing protein
MRRRSRAGGKSAKAKRRKTTARKSRIAPTAVRASHSSREKAEVARLTRELSDARQQQAAMSEILGIISRSNFQLQPVLQSVVTTAMRLCRAEQAVIYRQQDGTYRFAAGHSTVPAYIEIEKQTVILPDKGTVVGRTALTRQVARIDDAWNDPLYQKKRDAQIGGVRSMIGVPLMREGEPIGVIALARNRVEPFTEHEIDLVATFADQAVITIENARLFEAEQQRTRELTESLEQQTASSEVLKVISTSTGDLQPVFETMLEKAVRICDAKFGNIYRWDGETFRLLSAHNTPSAFAEARRRAPLQPSPDTLAGRIVATKAVIHVTDARLEQHVPEVASAVKFGGVRTLLVVPMLKDNDLIGAHRVSPGSSSLYRQANRAGYEFRRSGRHCHRECATAQRTAAEHR